MTAAQGAASNQELARDIFEGAAQPDKQRPASHGLSFEPGESPLAATPAACEAWRVSCWGAFFTFALSSAVRVYCTCFPCPTTTTTSCHWRWFPSRPALARQSLFTNPLDNGPFRFYHCRRFYILIFCSNRTDIPHRWPSPRCETAPPTTNGYLCVFERFDSLSGL